MAVQVATAGGMRTLLRLRVMHFGALRTVRTLKVMVGGTLRLVGNFYDDVSVSISGTPYGTSTGGIATTNSVSALATGGLFPYTFSWALVSHDNPGTPFPVNPTAATTAFRGFPDGTATFRLTVTDSLGTQGTATVDAYFANVS